MEIKSTYISFEQAKWLKEKGFDYHELFQDFADYYDYYDRSIQGRCHESDFSEEEFPDDKWIPVPEQWQVVEWLRINHGIWLYVKRGCEIRNNEAFDKFQPIIEFIPQVKFDITDLPIFDSPQEAYSAAFDYLILQNNLI